MTEGHAFEWREMLFSNNLLEKENFPDPTHL